jgi:hypothetical protein
MAQQYDPERLRLRDLCREIIAEQLPRHGSMPELFRTLAKQALPLRVTEKDLYKVRSETAPALSYKKLTRMKQLFEEAGLLAERPAQRDGMLSAIDSLSKVRAPAEAFLRTLPKRLLCFRRSYLSPDAINVSHVEISRDGPVIHYHERRVGTLADRLQQSEVRGTLVQRDERYYVLGLNEFRTRAGLAGTEDARSDILILSILEQVSDDLLVFSGLHLGVTPVDNTEHPLRPFASPVFMIETALGRDDAQAASLVRNYAGDETSKLARDLSCDAPLAERFRRYAVSALLQPVLDERYGLMIAPPPGALRPGRKASPRKPRG